METHKAKFVTEALSLFISHNYLILEFKKVFHVDITKQTNIVGKNESKGHISTFCF